MTMIREATVVAAVLSASHCASAQPAPLVDSKIVAARIRAEATRPNIFVLYEQNIGLLQPLIADELRQAERDYPTGWIEEAFRVAAEANVRRWSYVRAILERWSTEGRSDGTSQRDSDTDRRRYVEGKYADYIEY